MEPLLELLEEGVIYEAIATFEAAGCHATPLGVIRRGARLYAWVYPGTRLYHRHLDGCFVLSFPSNLLDIVRLVLGELRLVDTALCCPTVPNPYLLVEGFAWHEALEDDGRLRVVLEPRAVYLVAHPSPFTRLSSCLVELTILYTRLGVLDAGEACRRLRGLSVCISLLARRAVGEYRRLFKKLLGLGLENLLEHCS